MQPRDLWYDRVESAVLPGMMRDINAELRAYEGLIWKTAQRVTPHVEEEFDDVRQILRIKVWRALEAFDADRSKLPVKRYVFGCVTNQVKDLVGKKKRNWLFLPDLVSPASEGGEEFAGHRLSDGGFELRYLQTSEEEVFGEVEEEDLLLPSTLTPVEREIVLLLFFDYRQTEVAGFLDLTKREMEKAVKSIREKMADWRPQPRVEDRQLQAA